MLIPQCFDKIKIFDNFEDKYPIFFEITTTIEKANIEDDGKSKTGQSGNGKLQYNFVISTPGRQNVSVLNRFMKMILDKHEKDNTKDNKPMLYEFLNSIKDDDNRSKMIYRETPFKSGKDLDKNIFFEGKEKFLSFIDRFIPERETEETKTANDCYELAGITKKACILLHGSPGCGKSCTIKGILNRTGRHGIWVPWGNVKTCSELFSLFRSTKINDTPFEFKNFVFIFEDFDANKNESVKKRQNEITEICKLLGKDIETTSDSDSNESIDGEDTKKTKTDLPVDGNTLLTWLHSMNKKVDDELTLECVLNVLDGIAEMNDAMIIFTTNHLENIDPAFYRSGRVDYCLELKLASVEIIKKMVKTYNMVSDIEIWNHKFEQMKDYVISTSDVQSVCITYGKDRVEDCLNEFIARTTIA